MEEDYVFANVCSWITVWEIDITQKVVIGELLLMLMDEMKT